MKYQIRAIILGLSILGAAWILHDVQISVDHYFMDIDSGNTTAEPADSGWYTEDTARKI